MNAERTSWFSRSNMGYRLMAFLLAVLLWYFVAGQRNPPVERSFTRPVEARALSSQLVLAAPLPDVKVVARGAQNLIQSVTEEDLSVYVDLAGQEDGVSFVPVKTRAPAGIQVVRTEPEMIRVDLDFLEEKRVPVRLSLSGEPAPGFTALEPALTPSQVTVKGPGRLLNVIQEAQAAINVSGARNNLNQRVQVRVAKKTGQNLEVSPGMVEVLIPVVTQGPVKTVAVFADVQGKPKADFAVKELRVEPAKVDVTGAAQLLADLTEVHTKPVDISGAEGPVSKEIELDLPAGVFSVLQKQVKVTINVSAMETVPLQNE